MAWECASGFDTIAGLEDALKESEFAIAWIKHRTDIIAAGTWANFKVTKIENIAGKLNLGVLPKLLRALVHVWFVVVCH